MKAEHDVERAMRNRFDHAVKHIDQLSILLASSPNELKQSDIKWIKDEAQQLIQAINEFSAYWDVWHEPNYSKGDKRTGG